jgi:subtilase family serine protease
VFNAAAKAAVDSGMIIVAASGDNDSSDGGSTPSNVDFPASSPYVNGCGGTTLTKLAEEDQGKAAERKKSRRRSLRRPGPLTRCSRRSPYDWGVNKDTLVKTNQFLAKLTLAY